MHGRWNCLRNVAGKPLSLGTAILARNSLLFRTPPESGLRALMLLGLSGNGWHLVRCCQILKDGRVYSRAISRELYTRLLQTALLMPAK